MTFHKLFQSRIPVISRFHSLAILDLSCTPATDDKTRHVTFSGIFSITLDIEVQTIFRLLQSLYLCRNARSKLTFYKYDETHHPHRATMFALGAIYVVLMG